jgi:predicted NBD/HSP70 family sugar kinase
VGSAAIAADGAAAAIAGRCDRLAAVLESKGIVTAIDVLQCAQRGDSVAAELLARAGRLIGSAAATLVNVLNPSAVVLTGRMAQTGDVLLAAFRETLYRTCHPLVTRDLTIMRSVLGSSGSLVGAAIVATDALFEADTLAGWVGTGTPLQHPALLARIDEVKQLHQTPSAQPPSAFATSERKS